MVDHHHRVGCTISTHFDELSLFQPQVNILFSPIFFKILLTRTLLVLGIKNLFILQVAVSYQRDSFFSVAVFGGWTFLLDLLWSSLSAFVVGTSQIVYYLGHSHQLLLQVSVHVYSVQRQFFSNSSTLRVPSI